MLQKELAKRLRARYDTKMDGNGWLEVSSDGIPLCRVKYNGNCIVNDNKILSEIMYIILSLLEIKVFTIPEHKRTPPQSDSAAGFPAFCGDLSRSKR